MKCTFLMKKSRSQGAAGDSFARAIISFAAVAAVNKAWKSKRSRSSADSKSGFKSNKPT